MVDRVQHGVLEEFTPARLTAGRDHKVLRGVFITERDWHLVETEVTQQGAMGVDPGPRARENSTCRGPGLADPAAARYHPGTCNSNPTSSASTTNEHNRIRALQRSTPGQAYRALPQ